MRIRNQLLCRLILSLSILLVGTTLEPATGQVRIPAAARAHHAQLQQVLSQGKVLEEAQRWGEALAHYEKAAKRFPQRHDIADRLTTARIHFDVSRRYSDASFTSAIDPARADKSFEAYSEVLLKIQAYSVNIPNWQMVFDRGTRNLLVALNKPVFTEQVFRGWQPQAIRNVAQQLQSMTAGVRVSTRHDLYAQVSTLAREMARHTGIPPQVVVLEYTCGAASSLDAYSSFLTSQQYSEVMSQIDGNFVGLGIEIRNDNDTLLIVDVISGGPAQSGGLKAGERIVAVDGKETKVISPDTAADMLKGVDGSVVELLVESTAGEKRRIQLRRRRVDIPSVEDVHIADQEFGVGYIKLSSFQRNTLREFNSALWSLHHKGMRSLIVDVRGNPGGLLDASVEVADKFVSSGTIVATRGRNPREDFDHSAKQFGTWRVPLIVLIDGDSASASEIFAGAIRDHKRGKIVGARSYGKGSVQGIFPLNRSGAGIRLTTAKFYSPKGQAISGQGVTPDVTVYTSQKPALGGETPYSDSTLATALQMARRDLNRQ